MMNILVLNVVKKNNHSRSKSKSKSRSRDGSKSKEKRHHSSRHYEIRGDDHEESKMIAVIPYAAKPWPIEPPTPASLAASNNSQDVTKYKTQICLHWKTGYCSWGVRCNFAHGDVDVHNGMPSNLTELEQLRKENDFLRYELHFRKQQLANCSCGAAMQKRY